jgi:CMP-N-acetylneuraminic acid synthetase
MTRVVAIVPLKENSQRLPGKNLALLGDKQLYKLILESLSDVDEIDEIFIYSSSEKFKVQTLKNSNKIKFRIRPRELDADNVSINQVLREFLSDSDADIVVLAHATSPFLKAGTISNCISSVLSGTNDSALGAIKLNKFGIFRGDTINFDRGENLPPLQNIEPIIIEQGGLYVFKKEQFLKTNSRVGVNPHYEYLDLRQSVDIDTPEDFKLAAAILDFID